MVDDEIFYQYDEEKGILNLSAKPEVVKALNNFIKEEDGELTMDLPIGIIEFKNLKEVKSLPTKEGAYLLELDYDA